MADGMKKGRGEDPAELAQRLLRDLQGRFVRLNLADGHMLEDVPNQFRLSVGVQGRPKLGCEGTFTQGTSYERIRNSFSAWAETHARKLGVKKIYANVKTGDDDEDMDAAA